MHDDDVAQSVFDAAESIVVKRDLRFTGIIAGFPKVTI
jgi:hypothetical protein